MQRLLESNDLSTDESSLTGESLPAAKEADYVCPQSTPVAERRNMLYSGCFVSSGTGKAVVTAVGNNTELDRSQKNYPQLEKRHHTSSWKNWTVWEK